MILSQGIRPYTKIYQKDWKDAERRRGRRTEWSVYRMGNGKL